jgi:hypothetical protein
MDYDHSTQKGTVSILPKQSLAIHEMLWNRVLAVVPSTAIFQPSGLFKNAKILI